MRSQLHSLIGLVVFVSLTSSTISIDGSTDYSFLANCSEVKQKQQRVRFTGVKIFVDDLRSAKRFYTEVLRLEVISENDQRVTLSTSSWPITLELASEPSWSNYPKVARTGISFQTYKLLPQIDHFRAKGVKLYDSLLSRNGVGISIPFEDPSGNVMTILEVQIREITPFDGVQIYNSGVTISDMEGAIGFYESILGFEESSRNYLPDALPLKHPDGSFAFMIHYKQGLEPNNATYGKDSQIVLMFQASDLSTLQAKLDSNNINYTLTEGKVVCHDPEGNLIEISN